MLHFWFCLKHGFWEVWKSEAKIVRMQFISILGVRFGWCLGQGQFSWTCTLENLCIYFWVITFTFKEPTIEIIAIYKFIEMHISGWYNIFCNVKLEVLTIYNAQIICDHDILFNLCSNIVFLFVWFLFVVVFLCFGWLGWLPTVSIWSMLVRMDQNFVTLTLIFLLFLYFVLNRLDATWVSPSMPVS